MKRCAILDDYQNVALANGDWGTLKGEVEVTVFNDHLADEDAVAERLRDFEIVGLIRERTPFPRSLIERLPKLELLISTGFVNASVDAAAARERGVFVAGTPSLPNGTPELTWGLILALARQIPREDRNVREGRWQETVGVPLAGKTLGIVGLGRIGARVAAVAQALGMEVIAWSQNLTAARCEEAGARLVDKDTLFREADIVTIHLVLSERTTGLVGARELALMKPTAFLINTSRGPIVEEAALIEALGSGRIRGAGIDVYDVEPLPPSHPMRSLPNTVLTPHLGYVEEENYRTYFGTMIENVRAFLDGSPINPLRERH